MSSCDAKDVQLKAASPVYRRAREARRDAVDEGYCEAKDRKLEPCPDGWCRCSGTLRRRVETVDHPWGAPHQASKPHQPPPWSKEELRRELDRAEGARRATVKDVLAKLDALVAALEQHGKTLPEDELERLAELVEWRELLRKE